MKNTAKWISAVLLLFTVCLSPLFASSSHALSAEESAWVEEARTALKDILKDRTVMALVYLCDTYPLYAEASFDSASVITVPSGQQVQIQDVFVDDDYEIWEYVTLYYQDVQYTGYIPRRYLACSDELFLNWEDAYGMNPVRQSIYSLTGEDSYPDIEQFPESYRDALTALKQAHPNWTFVKMNTNLDWNTVVANEMVDGRSLIPSSFPVYMQKGPFSNSWALASEDTLKFYLDPRNSLTEVGIFQFEQLTYNASYHTEEAVQSFLNNTFMSGIIPNLEITFAKTFWAIGAELGVSPFHLACRVYQEQGKGTSPLISGTYPGYECYYNYFNIGASGKTDKEVIESGLAKAMAENWYNGYMSIYGGAEVISANYILKGQDTLYLEKFDVDASSNGLYWHQYMQNICAPLSEASGIRKSYEEAGSLDNTFLFKIPVYNNMPKTPCPKPAPSYDVKLTPPTGYTDANIYLDGIAYPAVITDDGYTVTAPDGNSKTAIMYRYNENGVPVGMYVWELSYNGIYSARPVPELENLLSYHGFSIRVTGNAGIRFKTGISIALREQLLSGLSGYTLKEYGTLAMNEANCALYPFIKGGQKVMSGRAYGQNADGNLLDAVFETVDNRYRYTSVLVNLPAQQYKTEFAFRGYIILTKDGQDIILYGPPVSKSIYALAELLLSSGYYEQGSSADLFLHQLIKDADGLE
mgnify:CR=1 FL=1